MRADIQALRGLAILLVLFYHADVHVRAGYLGVDIFFVISGFLITTLVKEGIERGDFSFREFYFRRAKRLLPAAYVTFLLTGITAPFILNPEELQAFLKQLAGAVTFTANAVLMMQVDYFGGAAETKPLLHVWSLAIEEQYYLVLPAALLLCPAPLRKAAAVVAAALSLALCIWRAPAHPTSTFYLPFTRAWELGIGTVGALGVSGANRWPRWLYWPALATVLALPLFPVGGPHPGVDALLVCVATIVIILRNHESVGRSAPVRALAHVGDMSYSLYLVHWPLISFAHSMWLWDVPRTVKLVLVCLSVAVARMLYVAVEEPTHRSSARPTRATMCGILLASAVVVAVPTALATWRTRVADRQLRAANFGLSAVCESEPDYAASRDCRSVDHPRVLVWGDSFAMHLVGGLVASDPGLGVEQATRSMCGPLLAAAPLSREAASTYGLEWARSCVRFNESVLDHLGRTPELSTVVLSSSLRQYVEASTWRVLDQGQSRAAETDLAVAGLRRTAGAVRALGRKVVFIAPPPSTGMDVGVCLERRALGLWSIGSEEDCSIPVERYRAYQRSTLAVLDRLAAEGVGVIRFDTFLCDSAHCRTAVDQTPLYRDAVHLSRLGSATLGKNVGLMRRVLDAAR